jgi:hypothetical protein
MFIRHIVVSVWLTGMTLAAQTTQGLISGRVANQASGQPLPYATVSYENSAAGARGERQADGLGFYSLPLLPPGLYRLRATAGPLYQPREFQAIPLGVAGLLEIDFELRPMSDVMDAKQARGIYFPSARVLLDFYGPDVDSGRALLLEPLQVGEGKLQATVSQVVDPQQIQELPLNGRDAYNALVLQPAVNADLATARGIGVSVNGQRPSSSDFVLDGLQNNNNLITGPLALVVPEALQEYRISEANFSAEYGGTLGYMANAITKAGTPQWHGLAYFNLDNNILDANDFSRNAQGMPRAPSKEDEPGFQAGGPVVRNRLFSSTALDYNASHGRGDPLSFYLPSTQFMNYLPLLAADNPARLLLTEYPPPAVNGSSTFDFTAPVTFTPPVIVDRYTALERADWTASGKDRVFGRLALARVNQPYFLWSPYRGFSSSLAEQVTSLALGWERVLGPTLTSEMHGGWSADLLEFTRPHPEVPTFLVNPDNQPSQFVYLPGSLAAYAYRNHGRNLEWNETLTWANGRHIRKFGGGLLLRNLDGYLTFGRDGEYVFSSFFLFTQDDPAPVSVATALSRQQLTAPAPRRVTPDYNRNYRYDQYNVFAQDSFRVTGRLVLNYGARYESFGAPINTGAQKDALVALGDGSTLSAQLTGASMVFPTGTEQLFSTGHGSFGVRLGISDRPFGDHSTVFRAAYGMFYEPEFDNLWQIVASNNFEFVRFDLTGYTPPQGVPFLQPLSQTIQTLPDLSVDSGFSPLTLYQPGMRDPLVHSFFGGMEHQASSGLGFELDGLGSFGTNLITTDVVNRSFSVPGILDATGSRLQPQLPDIEFRGNQGESAYFALTALAHYRSGRTQFQAAYTWSHSIDNQSEPLAGQYFDFEQFNPFATPPPSPVQASFTRQFDSQVDRGSSDFDQRHNLVLSAIYFLPDNSSWWRGWRVAAVGAVRSGLPYTVYGSGLSNGNLVNNRANLTDPADAKVSLPVVGGRQLLNAFAFQDPVTGQLGNTGRNAFEGPGFYNFDLSLARSFRLRMLGENGRLSIRFDAFNFLNHANLGNPVSVLSSPDFGVATYGRQESSTGEPAVFPLQETARRIQILLRVEF